MLTATFNEDVQANTVSFTLASSSGTSVTGSVSYNSATDAATFTPSTALAYGTKYTATVTGAASSSGTPMSAPFSWSFTTLPLALAVTSESPASGATNVSTSTTVTATFDEAVVSDTISFIFAGPGGIVVPATIAYSSASKTVTLTPNSPLAPSTRYTATINGVVDQSGEVMTNQVTWSFTTIAPAPVPPVALTQIQTVLNKRHQITKVVITFSGPLDGAESQQVAIYRLTVAGTHGSFTTKTARRIRPRSAIYAAALGQVTLILKAPLSFSRPIQLQVNGQAPSGLRDSSGRYINGGSNALAVLRRGGTSIEPPPVSGG